MFAVDTEMVSKVRVRSNSSSLGFAQRFSLSSHATHRSDSRSEGTRKSASTSVTSWTSDQINAELCVKRENGRVIGSDLSFECRTRILVFSARQSYACRAGVDFLKGFDTGAVHT